MNRFKNNLIKNGMLYEKFLYYGYVCRVMIVGKEYTYTIHKKYSTNYLYYGFIPLDNRPSDYIISLIKSHLREEKLKKLGI